MTPLKTCPDCNSSDIKYHKTYQTIHNGSKELHECKDCGKLFSETWGTPMEGLKSPLSLVASVIRVRSEGLGLRATARCFGIHKNTVSQWELRFSAQKQPLMLYTICHEFVQLIFEGDELYTVVGKRVKASDSEGWTAVIMERASRFIVEQHCGKKDAEFFKTVMSTVSGYIEQSKDLTFLSDGERRYGNMLFELCSEVLHSKKLGRPPKVLPKGVIVKIKNKGNKASIENRPKYEAPQREHPETKNNFKNNDIHANHIEAQNAALRRRNSAFRRRTNTYAKSIKGLQRTLDIHQVIHNFVRCLENILTSRFV